MDRLYPALVIVLVFAAVVLGYAIYIQRTVSITESPLPIPGMGVPPPPTQAPTPIPGGPAVPGLSQEEQEALGVPGPKATEAEKAKHYELSVRIAREAQELVLVNCVPQPVVLKAKNGSNFTVRNRGEKEATLAIDASHVYAIPAGGMKTLTAGFDKGAGLFGYGCNSGSGGGPGLILVTE